MPLVVDPSAIAPLVFADEDHAYSESVVRALASEGGIVPALFWFEIASILAINTAKRSRISEDDAQRFLRLIESMGLTAAPLPKPAALLNLAVRQGITAYDAAYLELAQRTGSAIATLDKDLVVACEGSGVVVFSVGKDSA